MGNEHRKFQILVFHDSGNRYGDDRDGYLPGVLDCKVTGSVTGKDHVGGIMGGDRVIEQLWGRCPFKGNSFTGKVAATEEGATVGAIIGSLNGMNKYNDISNNYYTTDCGAARAIGAVRHIDTSARPYGTGEDGIFYYNTSKDSLKDINDVVDQDKTDAYVPMIKTGLNRTDDPMGADAGKLAGTDEGILTYVIELKATGEYKKDYILGEELDLTGMILTAVYNNGDEKTVDLSEVTVSGYDKNVKGTQTVELSYKDVTTQITVKVLAPDTEAPIQVVFQLMGDKKHGEDGTVHTLHDGSLTSWVSGTVFTVSANSTVWDVLKLAEKQYGFKVLSRDSKYGIYVYGIEYQGTSLEEFDNGANSGWMATVNGEYLQVNLAEQYLNENDIVIMHYTDDYTQEKDRDPDEAKAEAAEKLILALPSIDKLTLKDKEQVEKARAYYNQLTDVQKGMIYTRVLEILKAAEAKIAQLEIPAHVHAYGQWKKISDATVFAPEKQERTCSCGAKETRDYGSALKATIKVNATTVPLKVKQKTSAFKVSGLANGDSVKSYKSSNTKIFTVTKNGVLKAGKKTGKATLTITLASGLQKKVTVKVQKKTVATSKITGLQKKVTLKKGKKLTLKPSRTPITSTQKFTFKSSNKKIANVSSKGVITAKKAGKAKITVKSGKKKYTVTVTVTK